MKLGIHAFLHEPTFTISYLVSDPLTKEGAVMDPELDFEQKSGRSATKFADGIAAAAQAQGIRLAWILETHAHADHLSAAGERVSQTMRRSCVRNKKHRVSNAACYLGRRSNAH